MAEKVSAIWLLSVLVSVRTSCSHFIYSRSQWVPFFVLFARELMVMVVVQSVPVVQDQELPSNKLLPWRQKANLCALCAFFV